MTIALFHDNPAYRQSCRFILDGHAQLGRGQNPHFESDQEQDQMTEAWIELTAAEKERLRGLSADLHMLQNRDVLTPVDPSAGTGEQLVGRIRQSIARKEGWELHCLLRHRLPFLSQAEVAELRGMAWQMLGHDDAAVLFLEFAAKLKPDNARARRLQVLSLLRLGRFEEARRSSESLAVLEAASLAGSLPAAG